MADRSLLAVAAAVALLLVGPVGALAHEGGEAEISCEPCEVTAGGTVVLAGTGLEPDEERVLDLVGADVIVPFDSVTTDADGMFSVTLTIPGHLPTGTYTFEAIGDETLTTDLMVTASGAQGSTDDGTQGDGVVTARERSAFDLAVLGAAVLIALLLGALLVLRAERFGRALEAIGGSGEQA